MSEGAWQHTPRARWAIIQSATAKTVPRNSLCSRGCHRICARAPGKGQFEVIKGFVKEYDAVKWIAEHSEAWREADRDALRVNY
jgi:hypothetical protein